MTSLNLKTTTESSRGLLILAAQQEGISVESGYGKSTTLTNPKLENRDTVTLPCGKISCTRRLVLEVSGSAIIECAGYQKHVGQSYWGSGCDYRAYDDYEPAPCANNDRTKQIAERIAFIANYETEEI